MTYLRFVCLFASTLTAAAVLMAVTQSPTLQRGVGVQMAASNHATPMPEADRENAWIVTVTADGQVYFGTDQVAPEGLAEQMKMHPRSRDAKLYIKADAGAPFSSVRQVLHAARVDLFDDVVLLTAQPEAAQPGTIAQPRGLDIWIGSEAGSNFVAVQLGADQGSARLRVGGQEVSPSALPGKLAQLFDNRASRIVVLKASGQASYAEVVRTIDTSLGAGASRIVITVSPGV